MWLAVHLLMIGLVVITPLVLVARDPGMPSRSLVKLLVAAFPLVIVGGLSGLLMSATGRPLIEWVLPLLAVLFVGLFCRSDCVFTVMRWGMLLVAVFLFVNFTYLVHGEFTAVPTVSQRLTITRQKAMITAADDALRKKFPPEIVLPEGPAGKILGDPRFDSIDVVTVERRWYTPLTRLYYVKHQRATLWYLGGEVKSSRQRFELRQTHARAGQPARRLSYIRMRIHYEILS